MSTGLSSDAVTQGEILRLLNEVAKNTSRIQGTGNSGTGVGTAAHPANTPTGTAAKPSSAIADNPLTKATRELLYPGSAAVTTNRGSAASATLRGATVQAAGGPAMGIAQEAVSTAGSLGGAAGTAALGLGALKFTQNMLYPGEAWIGGNKAAADKMVTDSGNYQASLTGALGLDDPSTFAKVLNVFPAVSGIGIGFNAFKELFNQGASAVHNGPR